MAVNEGKKNYVCCSWSFTIPDSFTNTVSSALSDLRVTHREKAFGDRDDCQRKGVLTSYEAKKHRRDDKERRAECDKSDEKG